MFKSKKLIRNVLAVCAIVFMSAVLCGAGCSNVAGGSGSGGGSSSGGGSGWSATSIGITMVSIRGGTVPMAAGYTPTVSNFSMGETEITQKQYKEILEWAKGDSAVKAKYYDITKANSSPSNFNGSSSGKEADSGENQENRPVEQVTWYDAVMYCNLLTMREMGESECAYNITNITYGSSNSYIHSATVAEVAGKKGYRLPTEAEWEYAARAGNPAIDASNTQYGNPATQTNLGDYAWYNNNSNNKTHEVKKKNKNAYGLYDMHGNVYEWCWDWYVNPYNASVTADPHGPSSGSFRVVRGGCWYFDAAYCAVSGRSNGGGSGDRDYRLGFRVVRRD